MYSKYILNIPTWAPPWVGGREDFQNGATEGHRQLRTTSERATSPAGQLENWAIWQFDNWDNLTIGAIWQLGDLELGDSASCKCWHWTRFRFSIQLILRHDYWFSTSLFKGWEVSSVFYLSVCVFLMLCAGVCWCVIAGERERMLENFSASDDIGKCLLWFCLSLCVHFCVFVCTGALLLVKKRMLKNFSASDDIGKCRPTIVLKATESFSNADLYEIYTNGYSAAQAHKCQIDKRQHNWLCFYWK